MLSQYKERFLFVFIVVFLLMYPAGKVSAGDETLETQILEEQKSTGEMNKLEKEIRKYGSGEVREIIPEFDPKTWINELGKGSFEMNTEGLWKRIASFFMKEFFANFHILLKLVVLVMICAVLRNLQSSFLSESVGELAFFVCYLVMITILIVSFGSVINLGRGLIDDMVSFMQATVPVLLTLIISGGNFTSGGVFEPVIIMAVQIAATIIKNIFNPLIFLSTILSILDNLSQKIHISKLADFFKQICAWSVGAILTVFIAVISLQGALGAVVDGVTAKTAKFAISAFIPVAGKYLADAADAVIGCTLIIKNAAGVVVMIGIIAICLIPLIKILSILVLYKIAAAIMEPVAEKRITECLGRVAGSITYILGICVAVSFMFLISVTAMIGASNLSAAIR